MPAIQPIENRGLQVKNASWRAVLATVSLTIATASPAARSAEDIAALPRYRLEVGQELVYHSQNESKYDGGSFEQRETWKFWVVQRQPDGRCRLVVQQREESDRQPARARLGYFDLFPDGRLISNGTLSDHLAPSRILIRLPANAQAAKRGWADDNPASDAHYRYQLDPKSNRDTYLIQTVRESAMDTVYLVTWKMTMQFDVVRGLPVKITHESKQGYGVKSQATGTIQLRSVEKRDGAFGEQLLQETTRYFELRRRYQALIRQAVRSEKDRQKQVADAEQLLKEAATQMKVPVVQDQIDEDLAAHARAETYLAAPLQQQPQIIGRPAPDWETTDLDGKSHSLKQYRGKVIILDFWYRGCGWCIRAMPQVKQLAEQFKGEPVVIFGMNTDTNPADARFVIDALRLNYCNLKATGLPEKYGVSGFPTLIIIDQEGVVRDVHAGYSATLGEEVAKTITALLKRR